MNQAPDTSSMLSAGQGYNIHLFFLDTAPLHVHLCLNTRAEDKQLKKNYFHGISMRFLGYPCGSVKQDCCVIGKD